MDVGRSPRDKAKKKKKKDKTKDERKKTRTRTPSPTPPETKSSGLQTIRSMAPRPSIFGHAGQNKDLMFHKRHGMDAKRIRQKRRDEESQQPRVRRVKQHAFVEEVEEIYTPVEFMDKAMIVALHGESQLSQYLDEHIYDMMEHPKKHLHSSIKLIFQSKLDPNNASSFEAWKKGLHMLIESAWRFANVMMGYKWGDQLTNVHMALWTYEQLKSALSKNKTTLMYHAVSQALDDARSLHKQVELEQGMADANRPHWHWQAQGNVRSEDKSDGFSYDARVMARTFWSKDAGESVLQQKQEAFEERQRQAMRRRALDLQEEDESEESARDEESESGNGQSDEEDLREDERAQRAQRQQVEVDAKGSDEDGEVDSSSEHKETPTDVRQQLVPSTQSDDAGAERTEPDQTQELRPVEEEDAQDTGDTVEAAAVESTNVHEVKDETPLIQRLHIPIEAIAASSDVSDSDAGGASGDDTARSERKKKKKKKKGKDGDTDRKKKKKKKANDAKKKKKAKTGDQTGDDSGNDSANE